MRPRTLPATALGDLASARAFDIIPRTSFSLSLALLQTPCCFLLSRGLRLCKDGVLTGYVLYHGGSFRVVSDLPLTLTTSRTRQPSSNPGSSSCFLEALGYPAGPQSPQPLNRIVTEPASQAHRKGSVGVSCCQPPLHPHHHWFPGDETEAWARRVTGPRPPGYQV